MAYLYSQEEPSVCHPVLFMVFYMAQQKPGVIYSVEEVRLMAYYIAKEGPGLLSTLSQEKSG